MTPRTLGLIGLLFLFVAVVLMVLNLRRVAAMDTFWIGLPVFLIGVILVIRAKKAR